MGSESCGQRSSLAVAEEPTPPLCKHVPSFGVMHTSPRNTRTSPVGYVLSSQDGILEGKSRGRFYDGCFLCTNFQPARPIKCYHSRVHPARMTQLDAVNACGVFASRSRLITLLFNDALKLRVAFVRKASDSSPPCCELRIRSLNLIGYRYLFPLVISDY